MDAQHRKGLVITLVGVLVLCPDALIVRLIDTDHWTLMFWRGLFMAIGMFVLYAAAEGPGWSLQLRRLGPIGLAACLLYAFNAICFVYALSHTTAANTLLIIATGPMFAALFSRIFLGERVARRTWLAIATSGAGIGFIFVGSLDGRGSPAGDLAALGTAVGLAASFTLVRRQRHVNMVPAMATGAFLAALISLPLAAPFSVSTAGFGWLVLLGLVILPVAFGLITLGPRYIPAPEVSLLMLLETVFGPLLVWLVIGEVASTEALIGGTIVVVTLAWHALAGLLRRDSARSPGARAAASLHPMSEG